MSRATYDSLYGLVRPNQLAVQQSLAIMASGTNPDGSSYSLPVGPLVDGSQVEVQFATDWSQTDATDWNFGVAKLGPVGGVAEETGVHTVTGGKVRLFRLTKDGKLGIQAMPHFAGGCATVRTPSTAAGSATKANVSAAAAMLYGYSLLNTNAAARFVHFHDLASASVTPGTTVPKISMIVPGGSGANVWMPQGVSFATRLSVVLSTGVFNNVDPAADEVVATTYYFETLP